MDNGAGKTTLLRCILGLTTPDRGAIRVLDRDPRRDPRAVREIVGYVPDQPDAYDWMCAGDLFRLMQGQFPSWNGRKAEQLLERMKAPAGTSFAGHVPG